MRTSFSYKRISFTPLESLYRLKGQPFGFDAKDGSLKKMILPKYNASMTNTLILLVLFTSGLLATGCSKDKDVLLDAIVEEDPINNFDPEKIIILPSDFNWAAIPEGHRDMVWEIRDDFDLQGQEVTLPEKVVLHFIDGMMTNGTLVGNETTIASSTTGALFQEVELSGSFTNEFIKPQWFGAVMDGVTDDRDAFELTIAQSLKIDAKVLVDKDMFLDVEETASKSLFIIDHTWIEGANSAKIIVNNSLSPVFWMPLSENITYKNLIIEWDQEYDATNMRPEAMSNLNQQYLKDWLIKNKNMTFSGTNPLFNGPSVYRCIFVFDGAKNITMDNITIKAVDGVKANRFIPDAVKFKSQYEANQSVTNEETATRQIASGISFKDVTFDGTIMAIQGTVQDFTTEDMKSYRYSDVQDANGNYIGGNIGDGQYNSPPPHLMYINSNQYEDNPRNLTILNTIDYGIYVGSPKVRATSSGYCNSFKFTGSQENVVVDGYKSYRRDGLGDLEHINNSSFKNMYAEGRSEIFEPSYRFCSLRFLGELNNVVFENIIIKDNSETSEIYPLDYSLANNVSMNNVHVYVKKFIGTDHGPFGLLGSENIIKNSSLNFENYSSTEAYRGVIFHDTNTLNSSSNNNYEITVNGWKGLDENPSGNSIRMLFANSSNTNNNYAKVTDVRNNYFIEQINNLQNDFWKRTEVVALGSGTSQPLTMTIPAGYTVKSVNTSTLENLVAGIQISLGTSTTQKTNLLEVVSSSIGTKLNTINEVTAQNGTRTVYIFSNKDFDNKGKIEVTLELGRISSYD